MTNNNQPSKMTGYLDRIYREGIDKIAVEIRGWYERHASDTLEANFDYVIRKILKYAHENADLITFDIIELIASIHSKVSLEYKATFTKSLVKYLNNILHKEFSLNYQQPNAFYAKQAIHITQLFNRHNVEELLNVHAALEILIHCPDDNMLASCTFLNLMEIINQDKNQFFIMKNDYYRHLIRIRHYIKNKETPMVARIDKVIARFFPEKDNNDDLLGEVNKINAFNARECSLCRHQPNRNGSAVDWFYNHPKLTTHQMKLRRRLHEKYNHDLITSKETICKVCNITFEDPESTAEHVLSANHELKAASFCFICNLNLPSSDCLPDHYLDVEHQYKILSAQEKKFHLNNELCEMASKSDAYFEHILLARKFNLKYENLSNLSLDRRNKKIANLNKTVEKKMKVLVTTIFKCTNEDHKKTAPIDLFHYQKSGIDAMQIVRGKYVEFYPENL